MRTSVVSRPNRFDKIPNETLDLIISFIPLDEFVSYRGPAYQKLKLHQVVVLMHVSRRFRVTMQQHNFWLDTYFCFDSLVDHESSRQGRRVSSLCCTMFSDPYFLECLRRKTEWCFSTLEVLFAIAACVPSFNQSVRGISFELDWPDDAILPLRNCKNLVQLDLCSSSHGPFNLSKIGQYCPQLRSLTLVLPYYTFGSLDNLRNLEELKISLYESDGTSILPYRSADTLTRMTINHSHLPDATIVSLKSFTSLKHVTAEDFPIGDGLGELMEEMTTDLESLDTWVEVLTPLRARELGVHETAMNKGWTLFDCLCLRNLKEIRLVMGCQMDVNLSDEAFPVELYIDVCMRILDTMVDKLLFLEQVEIWGGIDIERMQPVLHRLQNLKRFEWIIPGDGFVRGADGVQEVAPFLQGILGKLGREAEVSVQSVQQYGGRPWYRFRFDVDDDVESVDDDVASDP
jgi:hypothetical protein